MRHARDGRLISRRTMLGSMCTDPANLDCEGSILVNVEKWWIKK